MTPAVLDRPAPLFVDRAAGAVSGGRVTLEERLASVLNEAHANGSSECPLCHARVTLTPAAAGSAGTAGSAGSAVAGPAGAASPATAECTGCGSRLS